MYYTFIFIRNTFLFGIIFNGKFEIDFKIHIFQKEIEPYDVDKNDERTRIQ